MPLSEHIIQKRKDIYLKDQVKASRETKLVDFKPLKELKNLKRIIAVSRLADSQASIFTDHSIDFESMISIKSHKSILRSSSKK